MKLHFNGSQTPTIGVEIELQIINPETFDLKPSCQLLLAACEQAGLERVKCEIHQSMVEIDTEISCDVKECHAFLSNRLQKLTTVADQLELQLGLAGTHPFQRWAERRFFPSERYQFLHEKFQWLSRRLNVYGMHLHVGVPSGEKALAISSAAIRYLPHLLALSANSPFWDGIDTGMQSSRVNIMESFPFSGVPPIFRNWHAFEHYVQTLQQAEVISSLKDLYWYIRPNLDFGTVEFRICDVMSSLDETMAITALIHCLVVWISERLDNHDQTLSLSKEEHWIALENQLIAARDGLDGTIITNLTGERQKISESVLQLVQELQPISKRLNCEEELLSIHSIISQGNGAQKQRAILTAGGTLHDVVASYTLNPSLYAAT